MSLAWSARSRAARLGLVASLLGLASLLGAAPVGAANEITLFLEGPQAEGPQPPIFGTEIEELRSLASRFERVRSLVEYPIEELTA